MLDAICTFPLTSDLFAQCIHPKSPLLALGLASGHVQLIRLPPSDGREARNGTIDSAWRTRRHKGSCRSLCFSHDGEHLLSAGTDGLVKAATTETGQVVSKIAVPLHDSATDPTSLIYSLSPQTILLATDSSALHLYDLRSPCQISSPPSQTHHPHDDYISSLTPLAPTDASTSGYSKKWISTGGTTVAVTDLRRGVLVKSEDQREELLSSTILDGKLVVGGEKGGLRMWEVGVWDDNEETIVIGKCASADVLAAAPEGQTAAIGMDDGVVRFVAMGGKRAKVVEEVRHDEVEGVLGLGFEVGGRMISGGGSVVKVWEESLQALDGDEDEEDDVGVGAVDGKRTNGFGSGDDDSDKGDGESSEEEEEKPRKKKKRKKNKGKGQNGVQHVMAFKDMD